jgi:hypothetical protein
LAKLYAEAAKVRDFGMPYPKISLAEQLKDDSIAGAVVAQGDYAESWYMCSKTHDNGINDKIIKYYEDAINKVVNEGDAVSDVMPTLIQGIGQVLGQYNLGTASE